MFLSSIQIQHLKRNFDQKLSNVQVGIIGGYHGGNLGDMALGMSVSEALKAQNLKHGLQTIYNLGKWPKAPFAIIGGGAVGYIDSLRRVIRRYQNEFDKVALLGVDFMEKEYPADCIQLIQEAAFVSCRSEAQALKLIKITNRNDIFFHPDIAFSLLHSFCKEQRAKELTSKKKQLLINVVPLYAKIEDGKLKPIEKYKEERPELYANFQQMHDAYKEVVRTIAEKSLIEGFSVESIPFTPGDDEYARIILKGLPVTFNKYYTNPERMLRYMANAQRVIATRFHATTFALKGGAQLYPIAYATKNELMLKELGISRDSFLSTTDLANGKNQVLDTKGIDPYKILLAEERSSKYIHQCIESLIK